MLTYHKIFKANQSIYLSNSEPVFSTNEGVLNRLTGAKNTEERHNAKVSILKDFQTVYAFDATNAEFPEPVGRFVDDWEKHEFAQKKIPRLNPLNSVMIGPKNKSDIAKKGLRYFFRNMKLEVNVYKLKMPMRC